MPSSSVLRIAQQLHDAIVARDLAQVERLAATFTAWADERVAVEVPSPLLAVMEYRSDAKDRPLGLTMARALLAPLPPRALYHDVQPLPRAIHLDWDDLVNLLLPLCDPRQAWGAVLPLGAAAYRQNLTLMDRLIPLCDVNQANADGETVLMSAARNDRPDSLRRLLDVPGVELNQVDPNGRTALFWTTNAGKGAAAPGYGERALDVLLDAGADPNRANDQGRTPLMNAIVRHQPWLVKRLLNQHLEAAPRPNDDPRPAVNLLLRDQDGHRADDLARAVGFMPALRVRLEKACAAQERAVLHATLDGSPSGAPDTVPRLRSRL